MKNNRVNIGHLMFCISAVTLFSFSSYGQLTGNYTINPRQAASSSNYQNWASAVGDLLSGSRTDGGSAQGPGVNSKVTITVYDTVYANTTVELTAINGTSYTNTVTFKSAGGDSSKCVIQNASSTSATNDFVLMLNGANYVTFQEIGMVRTGNDTYSSVVQISNNSDNCRLIRCLLSGRKVPSNSTLGFAYGIGSVIYFTGNADSVIINGNKILYGYNGIFNVTACTGNLFTGNIIDTSGSSGMYMTSQTSLRIIGNKFNLGDFGPSKGHYTSYGLRIETSPSLVIAKNIINMSAVNAQVVRAVIVASTSSSSTAPALVYNNWVMNSGGTNDCTGLTEYACNYVTFYYNNVLITNSLASGAAYYHYANFNSTYVKLINNNLINKGGGYAYNVPGTNIGDIDSVNFNNVYTNGTNLANWGGTNYTSLSSFYGASAKDANSLNVDPGYANNSDLHVSNFSLNGKALPFSGIQDDIEGETRDQTNPDIGADEFFPASIDVGVANLDSPLLFCPGKQNVKVSFQNYGNDTIKSVDIHWQINGTSQSTYNWSGKVAPGNSSSSITLGSYTFSANTAYAFKTWTKNPNNTNDGKNINDTLKLTRLPAMSGNYSIDDTATANFKSFNEAITAMTSRGICGAIDFNVYPATYSEQITLVQIPGMGSSNPVKFVNAVKDSTRIIVTLPSTVATGTNNAAIQLRGADYVTFNGITFERTGTNPFSHVLHILNGSNNNTFSNCQMLGQQMATANLSAMNIWSDQGQDNNNVFRNNYVKNGKFSMLYSGINTQHETGTVVEGNIFENAYDSTVRIRFNDGVTVRGNIFLATINTATGNFDLQLFDCDSSINVNGNYFKSAYTESSILLTGCTASKPNPGIIANNSIIRSSGKGILVDGVDNQNIVFNSMYFNSNISSNAGIYSTSTASSNLVMRNNNIVMEGGDVFYISAGSQVSISDNNNLSSKGGQLAYWNGTACSNLSALVTASGRDIKSLSANPFFTSATDLHIKNPLLKGAGVPISGVTKDFDGETRNSTTPDIGADEFKLVSDDAGMVAIAKPVAGTCAGPLDVEAIIKNYGGDTLKSATINWTVSGVAQAPVTWKGKLKTNGLDTIYLGKYDFTNTLSPQFMIKTSLPNGKTDGIRFNDSVIITRSIRGLPQANAGQDFTICPGDSVSIGPGTGTGLSYRWTTLSNVLLGTTAQIWVKPAVTTKYILEVTNVTFGCQKRDTIELSIGSKPNANAGKDAKVCKGASVQIGETSQSGFNYGWISVPGGFTSSIASPFVAPTQTTTYIIEKTINATGCFDYDTVVVTVTATPTPQIFGTGDLCNGNSAVYSTAANAGNTYNWVATGGQVINGQNTNNVTVRWNTSGTGNLKVIETNATGCKDSFSFFVNIIPKPVADFSAIGVCVGRTTKFTDLSVNAKTYEWTFGDGGSSGFANPTHIYTLENNYLVRLIVTSNAGCSDTTAKTITINPYPAAGISLVQKPGKTVEFSDSSTISLGSISSWKWKFGDGDSSDIKNPTHQYNSEGTFTVRLCVTSLAGCENCVNRVFGIAGIHDASLDKSFTVTPNPGAGIFTIRSSQNMEWVAVTNMLGQLVLTLNPDDREFEIDMSDHPAGVYSFRVGVGEQIRVMKVIKN